MGTAALGILIIGGSIALALLVHLLVRRNVPLEVLEAHHAVAGHMLAIVGGMFGVLLAFTVVVVWEQYDRAREGAASEANAAADLFRITRGLPPEISARIDAELRDYLKVVATEEWRLLAEDGASPRARRELGDLWREVVSFQPADDGARNLHLQALISLREISDQRRLRLLHAEHALPGLLWVVLVVGAVLTVAYANFFGLRFRRSHSLMLGALAGMIALVIFAIWVLDHPYSGRGGIWPVDYELVLKMLDEPV